MAPRTAWTKIKDFEYGVQLMDGETALRKFGTLSKFLGGPLGRMLGSLETHEPEQLGTALSEIGDSLASDDFMELVKTLLEGCVARETKNPKNQIALIQNGVTAIFAGHFAGEFGTLVGLIWFALKENYGGFLDGLPKAKGALQRAQQQAQQRLSPKEPTGGLPG